jgi:hypothetical protein
MRLRAAALLTLLAGVCLVAPALVKAQSQSADPTAIVENYEAARNRHDVDAALALFSDDAVVTDRTQRVYAGKDAIRRFLEQGGTRLRAVAVVDRQVVGNHVTWTERLSSQSFNASFQVEAVVQSGQIKLMSYVPAGSTARVIAPEPKRSRTSSRARVAASHRSLLARSARRSPWRRGGPSTIPLMVTPSNRMRGRTGSSLRYRSLATL